MLSRSKMLEGSARGRSQGRQDVAPEVFATPFKERFPHLFNVYLAGRRVASPFARWSTSVDPAPSDSGNESHALPSFLGKLFLRVKPCQQHAMRPVAQIEAKLVLLDGRNSSDLRRSESSNRKAGMNRSPQNHVVMWPTKHPFRH